MSNREALRKLSRKFPAPPEIKAIWEELRDQKDIAIALVSSAIIEATLERLIENRFKSKDKNLAGQIFLNRGPLGDFHSKILIAHAFGIITSPLAEQLHSIKAIRNVFAHAKMPMTFDNEIIHREITSLSMFKILKGDDKKWLGDGLELSPRAWFRLIAQIVHIILDGLSEHEGSADDALKAELEKPSVPPSSPEKS